MFTMEQQYNQQQATVPAGSRIMQTDSASHLSGTAISAGSKRLRKVLVETNMMEVSAQSEYCVTTVKILKFGTPQTIAIIVLKNRKV